MPPTWQLICPPDNWRNPIPWDGTANKGLAECLTRCGVPWREVADQKKFYAGEKKPGPSVVAPGQPGQVTPHFHVSEFHCSDGTPYPAHWVADRLTLLCNVLESIRKAIGASLTVTSGYRTPDYNRSIGGASDSQHIHGRAADIWSPELEAKYGTRGMVNRIIAAARDSKAAGIGVSYADFVHVDVRPGGRVEW